MSSAPGVTASDWMASYPPARSLTLDPEALRIYQRAYHIGSESAAPSDPLKAEPAISFKTLLIALLDGSNAASTWFAEVAKQLGPRRSDIVNELLEERHIDATQISNAPDTAPSPNEIKLSNDKQLLTSSSREVMVNAENWAQRVGGSEIGVRHLIASYVINPPAYHRQQLQQWGVNVDAWRAEFFGWVARTFSWEQWTDASQLAAPSQKRVAFEQQPVKAKTLVWPADEQSKRVLAQAVVRHSQRSDPALGFATMFFALVDCAGDDAPIRDAVLPVWTAVQNAGAKYAQAVSAYFPAPQAAGGATTFDDLAIDPRVLNALETARELAATSLKKRDPGVKGTVGVLHLAGSLLSRRVEGDNEFRAIGLELGELRRALFDHAVAHAESKDAWRELLGLMDTQTSGRAIDLNSDEPEAIIRLDPKWKDNDPLAIRPDVEVFASLLASRDLEPPLSVGLFGPWGSGKTTFLKRLRQSVQRHSDEARTIITQNPQAPRGPYVANVVHVEFNAWHFAEGALVSSLVDATIRAISAYVKDPHIPGPAEWLNKSLADLESRRRQLDAAEELSTVAEKAVKDAHQRVTEAEVKAQASAVTLKSAVQNVWTLAKVAIADNPAVKDSGVLAAIGDSVQSAEDLQRRLDALRARPARMLGDLGWIRTLLFAAMVLVLPPLVGLAVKRTFETDDIRALLSTMTAVVTVAGLWFKAASGAVSKVDRAVAEIAAKYEDQIARDKGVVAAQAMLAAARASADTAGAGLEAARAELARAQTAAANATLPAQTLQLVNGRIEDRSYAKELTTLSIARADLEKLSSILRDQKTVGDSTAGPLRAVDRVILYIDDLDRCKPEDVVRVLQLVHMLLAFELFVVIVAVDARWVEQALKRAYPWLYRGRATAANPNGAARRATDVDSPVTPEDYLEKIFQIAFWLEPMTAGRASDYLGSLVRPVAAQPDPSPGAAMPPPAPVVDVSEDELNYMRAFSAYVGSSPRRVKRLVNAYRLIKARLSEAQLKEFVTDRAAAAGKAKSGPYEIVIGLLVIGTGAQSASSAILGELGNWDQKDSYTEIVEKFRARNDPEWTSAAQVIETVMRSRQADNVSELRGWARKVGRFLLHGPTGPTGTATPTPVPPGGPVERKNVEAARREQQGGA
jgi:hypothetical protein